MENSCKIVAFGDSITLGYADKFRDYIINEYKDIELEVINAGVKSETSNNGLSRIQSIIDQEPDVVIVGFGMNDWRKGVSKETFKNNLKTIIDRLEQQNVRVILMTIIPDYNGPLKGTSDEIDKYNCDIKLVSQENRIRIADVNSLWKREITPIQAGLIDAFHPNALGNEIICKSLIRVVPRRNTTVVWAYNGFNCACNYACPYCYQPANVMSGHHFIGPMKRWHDAFKRAFANQHVTFYIAYGEPMIGNVFYEMVEMFATEPNWEMMMTTNLSQPLTPLIKTQLAKDGRLNINTSFHPTNTTVHKFLEKLLFLREHGIECPVIYVMYPGLMKDFEYYFEIFDKYNFLVHIRAYQGIYKGKVYPGAYTEQERRFVAKYADNATIKYALNNTNIYGKLSYAGMYYVIVNNRGDVAASTQCVPRFKHGNVLLENVRLDLEPQPFPTAHDATVSGIASLLEIHYRELEQNHVISFAKQGGVFHGNTRVHYPHLQTDFNDQRVRKKYNFPDNRKKKVYYWLKWFCTTLR